MDKIINNKKGTVCAKCNRPILVGHVIKMVEKEPIHEVCDVTYNKVKCLSYSKLQNRWLAAIPEPYYPSWYEKIFHFFGVHVYGGVHCLICGKEKKNKDDE